MQYCVKEELKNRTQMMMRVYIYCTIDAKESVFPQITFHLHIYIYFNTNFVILIILP